VITVKKSKDRVRTHQGGQDTWRSFNSENPFDPGHDGFRSLECLREEVLAPGAAFEFDAPRNLEVLSYVWMGSVLLVDPGGRTVALEMGECHRSAARTGARYRGVNDSRKEPARVFQALITPDRSVLQTPPEKRRFSIAERRGVLRLLVSRAGGDSSLRLRQDARIYSSILDPGHHLVHELTSGRGAWLQVVKGRLQLVDQILEAGDGAGLVEEPAVSLTAREPSEILLFDLA
jgi:quercetin 2,3-dioxygenase